MMRVLLDLNYLMHKYIFGAVFSLVFLISPALVQATSIPAQPVGLSSAQIQAILSLLHSFGASDFVISNVRVSLTGGTPTPPSPTPSPQPVPIALSASPSSGPAPLVVTFTTPALSSDASLNFGDGNAANCTRNADQTNSTCNFTGINHTYSSAGNYTATLSRSQPAQSYSNGGVGALPPEVVGTATIRVNANEIPVSPTTPTTAGLSVSRGPNDPASARNVIAGTSQLLAGQFSFTAQTSAYTIDKIRVKVPSNAATSITSVTLRYKNVNGVSTDSTQVLLYPSPTEADAVATFTGLTMYVPANNSVNLDVYLGLSSILNDGDSGKVIVNVALDTGATSGSSFRAIDSAGMAITQINSGIPLTSNGTFSVRKSLPTISAVALDSNTLTSGTNRTIGRFKISADPAGDVSWGKIVFTINKSSDVTIGDVSTMAVWQGSNRIAGTFVAVSNSYIFLPSSEQVIPAGSSVTYELRTTVGIAGTAGVSSIGVLIGGPATSASTGTFTNVGAINSVQPQFVWSDKSSVSAVHSFTTSDWANDYGIRNLPLSIGNLSAVIGNTPVPAPLSSISATCSVSPTSGVVGDTFTWTVNNVTGGDGSYTYSWFGSNYGLGFSSGLTSTTTVRTYPVAGLKLAQVTITSGGVSKQINCTNYATVVAPPPPTVTLTASPQSSVTPGTATFLSWSSTGATSCTAKSDNLNNLNIVRTVNIPTLNQTRPSQIATLRLNLIRASVGLYGNLTNVVRDSVGHYSPDLDMTGDGYVTAADAGAVGGFRNAFNFINATNPGWTGDIRVSGDRIVTLSTDTIFSLTCRNAGGERTATATVTMVPPPTITLSADPMTISSGGTSSLSWSSTGATSCRWTDTDGDSQFMTNENTISGTNRPTQSLTATSIYSDKTYRISCTGPGGVTKKGVRIRVNTNPVTLGNTRQIAGVAGALRESTPDLVAPPVFSYVWNRDLQLNSPHFEDVIALQVALTYERVYSGDLSGGFYNQTFTAVKSFQQKYGIEATGFVGPATRAKLNALYAN